jgi:hypothetical protein
MGSIAARLRQRFLFLSRWYRLSRFSGEAGRMIAVSPAGFLPRYPRSQTAYFTGFPRVRSICSKTPGRAHATNRFCYDLLVVGSRPARKINSLFDAAQIS